MKKELQKVAIRKNALVLDTDKIKDTTNFTLNETTSVLLANCARLGYTFSEDVLYILNASQPMIKLEVFELLKEVTGVNKNWTPLVKQWNIPTEETVKDHIITWFANVFKNNNGTRLPCNHIIPENTFPLDRYNGCPFCGTPFEFEKLDYEAGHNKLKVLSLWTENDLKTYLDQLLTSPVALDATQVDDLKILVKNYGVSKDVKIGMKETRMIVVDTLVESQALELAGQYFDTPNDILRYLWYKNTGFLQIVEPKTILKRVQSNARNLHPMLDESVFASIKGKVDLKLKFSRPECKMYAQWLNNLEMDVVKQCEQMHPKREMWVRVIRALRLAEYSKRKGFEKLAEMLDVFYNQRYEVWQGKVNQHKKQMNADETFELLKQRPGLFARSLFSTMLWFGPNVTLKHFKDIMDQVPDRLIFTLNMYADTYFDKNAKRSVKPLGGTHKMIPPNKLLQLYSEKALSGMQLNIQSLSKEVIRKNFQKESNANSTIYIEDTLHNIPIGVGDRNEHVQDQQGALMGTRFKVGGDTVRLFIQWGEGLKAQHLDMDLSCSVIYENRSEFCSYSQLVIPGCKHSGDIRYIPDQVGTAEYIDLNVEKLRLNKAKYVVFTCNAYSSGSITPNLVAGWMNSKYPMKISSKGVAYDPTAVKHQVKISKSLTKGLVFGVLNVEKSEITWLEMSFAGQIVQGMNNKTVEALLNKLDAKLKIGELLQMKAEVQGLIKVQNPEDADEVYDEKWALNTAQVNQFFMGEN